MLSFALPFQIALGVLFIVLFSLNIIRAEIALRKMGLGGVKGWYKSLSSSTLGRNWRIGSNGSLYSPLKFYCMNCGYEHRKITCPKCGSKAVKAT